MARVPELYVPEHDQQSREEGTVYIADLMASHVLTSLKRNCAPQGLGFLHGRPVSPDETNALHRHMSEALSLSERELHLGVFIGEISVRSSYQHPEAVDFSLDYWEGRPMKTTISTGPDTDRDMLTGFRPFSPRLFDRDQGQGQAQKTIDALRVSGDTNSLEVQTLEGVRTFERAEEARDLSFALLTQALKGKENPELAEALAEALDQYDKITE